MKKAFLIVALMLSCIGLNAKIDNHGNNHYQYLSEENPTIYAQTAIAVAQFALSVSQMNSSGDNSTVAVIGLLEAVNDKLTVISNQLSEIYSLLQMIPKQTKYQILLSQTRAEISEYHDLINKKSKLINDNGKRKGTKLFLKNNEVTIRTSLEKINKLFHEVKIYYDPITSSLVSLLCTAQFSYETWLKYSKAETNIEISNYQMYFLKALQVLESEVDKVRSNLKKTTTSPIYKLVTKPFFGKQLIRFYESLGYAEKVPLQNWQADDLQVYKELDRLGAINSSTDPLQIPKFNSFKRKTKNYILSETKLFNQNMSQVSNNCVARIKRKYKAKKRRRLQKEAVKNCLSDKQKALKADFLNIMGHLSAIEAVHSGISFCNNNFAHDY